MKVSPYIRSFISSLWPSQWQRVPFTSLNNLVCPDERSVFFHFGDTPTLHYYWKSRFPKARYIDTSSHCVDASVLSNASMVVIIRHIGSDWLQLLKEEATALPSVTLFLDDDIPGILSDYHLPLKYVLKTAARYGRNIAVFNEIKAGVLVASPGLAELYRLPETAVVAPKPMQPYASVSRGAKDGALTIFYHGTSSHMREIRWLHDIIEGVSARLPGVVFELFGGRKVSRLYHDVKSVRVVRPMPWKSFFKYTSSVNYDIGLAPLLDSPFNACRSHVKYFDITRAGGVGVYSDTSVFRAAIEDGINGVLVENKEQRWIDTICMLAQNTNLRCQLFSSAAKNVNSLGKSRGADG